MSQYEDELEQLRRHNQELSKEVFRLKEVIASEVRPVAESISQMYSMHTDSFDDLARAALAVRILIQSRTPAFYLPYTAIKFNKDYLDAFRKEIVKAVSNMVANDIVNQLEKL